VSLLRALLPFLPLAAAGVLRARAGSPDVAALVPLGAPQPEPPSTLGLGLLLCGGLLAVRLALAGAARRDGVGPGAPPLRGSMGRLGAAQWTAALTFAALAIGPVLPDRRLPAIVAVTCLFALALRALGQGARRDRPLPRGEERHWLAGFLYANPRDGAALVPSRLGLGYTPNLGRPLGWLLLAAALTPPALLGRWLAG